MRFLIFIICLSFVSCDSEELTIDKANAELELINGVLYYQNIPFDGLLVSKYDDASYKMQLRYRDGRKEGEERQWYANGQLSQRRTYSKGIKIGNHQGWWNDGTPKFKYYFNGKGEYEGNRKEWYQNGQLVLDFNYSQGKETGSQRMWMDNGKIRANYEVKNGERFGLIGLKKCYTVNIDSNELQ